MTEVVRIPLGQKPDPETQKLIDEGKLVKGLTTTGGINPSAKCLKPGTYYYPVAPTPN